MSESRTQTPEAAHAVGDNVHGFTIQAVTTIAPLHAICYEAQHDRTGARIVDVHCFDDENLFSVGFVTPVSDSRGAPHILEHSVLAGSKRFPVKDAFAELSKRSLATFLNAFTWPDRTIYPAASAVQNDLFNLATVYMDVVFRPMLSAHTFMQEGHHLAPSTAGFTISGIVFNEMGGVYSSAEALVERALRCELFSDTPYQFDSGGDPLEIPLLTHAQLQSYHKQFYTPANSRFFVYGDLEPGRYLAFIDNALEGLPAGAAAPPAQLQTRWSAPRTYNLTVPHSPGQPEEAFVALAWLGCPATDIVESLALELAVDAVAGSAITPMHRSLVGGGYGKDLFPEPCSSELAQMAVRFGVRGADPQQAAAIEAIILDTLRNAIDHGLDEEIVEGALHQLEFGGKEVSPPFPVLLLERVGRSWYYGADPKLGLDFSSAVEELRRRRIENPRLLEETLRHHVLDNPHRLLVLATPSTNHNDDHTRRLGERVAELTAPLSAEDRQRVCAQAEALRHAQQQPDSPQAIATLPVTTAADIPQTLRSIPVMQREVGEATVIETGVFTNGIVYLGCAFSCSDIASELASVIPLTGAMTCELGAGDFNHEAMQKRIDKHTGGVGLECFAGTSLAGNAACDMIAIDGKALAYNSEHLVAILGDMLTAPRLSEPDRIREYVHELAARAQSAVIPRGSGLAISQAAKAHGWHHVRRDQLAGVGQLLYLKQLSSGLDDQLEALIAQIGSLQTDLYSQRRLLLSVVAEPSALERLRPLVDKLIRSLPLGTRCVAPVNKAAFTPASIGLSAPTQVCFAAQAIPAPPLGHPSSPAMDLLSHVLTNDYLYQRIRVQGGAYGGYSGYSGEARLLTMASYRDPQLDATFDVYAQAQDYLSKRFDRTALEASRLGAIGSFDRILGPEDMLSVARRRHVLGVTTAMREAYRSGLLNLTAEDVRELCFAQLADAQQNTARSALASPQRLAASRQGFEVVALA